MPVSLRVASGLALCLVAVAGGLALMRARRPDAPSVGQIRKQFSAPRQFSVEEWERQPTRRFFMAEDLTRSRILLGMPRSEVIGMLGRPTDSMTITQWFPDASPARIREELWLEDSEPLPVSLDRYDVTLSSREGTVSFLDVYFDSHGRVSEAWLDDGLVD